MEISAAALKSTPVQREKGWKEKDDYLLGHKALKKFLNLRKLPLLPCQHHNACMAGTPAQSFATALQPGQISLAITGFYPLLSVGQVESLC